MSTLLAMLLDWLAGEPPAALHPVCWIGRYLGVLGPVARRRGPVGAFVLGGLFWLLGALAFTGVFAVVAWLAWTRLPWWGALLVQGVLLKPLLSLRLLREEVAGVGEALVEGLPQGRERLSRIVSRNTGQLSEGEVRESALESFSENLSDSLVAPLFWFAVLGLPGAAFYRFCNTADAMWGYRGQWEWAGKWAARADDILNFVPARLTALVIRLVAATPATAPLSLEAARTPSPNSGWPMAALALSLGVRLGKPGVYVLNPGGRVPEGSDFAAGLRLCTLAGWTAAGLFAFVEVLLLRVAFT